MADFNPDAYLATPPATGGGFDPDAYLAAKPEKPGVMARLGAAAAGGLAGTAEMLGLQGPVEVAEYAMGREPARHIPVAGPFGATESQVREVERQAGETRKAVQQAGGVAPFVVQGVTQPFQKLGQAFTAPPQTLGEAYDVGKAVPQAAATLQAGRGALRTLGGAAAKLPGVAQTAERVAAAGQEAAAIRAAEQAPLNIAIEKATKEGFKLPPSQAGGPTGKMLEGVGGKIQTEMKLSRDNAVNTNKIAAREIGLSPRQAMTEANLERLKQPHFDVYKRVASKGRIASDEEFRAELHSALDRTAEVALDYPEDYNKLVQEEIKKFDKPSANASSMLDRIKSLRNRASRNMKSLSNEDFELGLAQKKIATAMENLIERQVAGTDPTLIADFRNARTQLAKIYGVEEAVGPSGNVSAAVLARQLKRDVPLSGGLKTIAETYMEFPKVMRSVEGLGGHAPFSALDYLVGGVEAAANPAAAGKVVGALMGRPIARSIISSKPYQQSAIKPRSPQPSLATRVAEKVVEAGKETPKAEPQTLRSLDKKPKSEKPYRPSPGPIGRQRGSFSLAETYKNQNSNVPKTGEPVTLHYSRNPESSTKHKLPEGMDVGRNIEPHGEYMNVDYSKLSGGHPEWERGTVTFKNPLVLEHQDTTSKGWKKTLSDMFGGKTGKSLTDAVKKAGYDGIITHDKYGLSETVNLSGKKSS